MPEEEDHLVAMLNALVECGMVEMAGVTDTGEWTFQLTAAGRLYADALTGVRTPVRLYGSIEFTPVMSTSRSTTPTREN
jgi:hypothetical protein